METTWYLEIEPQIELSQGDVFFNAPVFTTRPSINYFHGEQGVLNWEVQSVDTQIEIANYVVLNQACDLENKPPENLIVAELIDAVTGELKNGVNRKGFLKEVHAGKRQRYTLIGEHSSKQSSLSINYQIVDLATIYTVPYSTLDEFRKNYGSRLRLNTPHRELLNQQFGNFYSRIGLPNQDFIPLDSLLNRIAEKQP